MMTSGQASWTLGKCTSRSAGIACSLALLLGVSAVGIPLRVDAQWISPPGEGWASITFFHHDTERTFDTEGERRLIFADGRAVTRSVFVTANVGVWRGIDLWVQLPFHHLRFNNAGGERVSSGLSDPRGFVRIGPALVGLPPWPVAVRGGFKLDSGDFDVDSEIIPLGEGQRDWELLLEAGQSFYPRPFWTMGWIGYRWRLENVSAGRKPGDELFWWWSVGGEVGRFGWQGSLEVISGEAWTIQGLPIERARRELNQLFLQVDHPAGPGRISLGGRIPLSGRNLPAGPALTAGYFVRWGSD